MIQVEKSNVPQVFVDFVEHDNPKSWDDIHKSNRYPNVYADSRRYILEVEQGGVSAYTERCLYNSGNLHIDHFRRKGLNWPVNQTFVWKNLFVDERSNNYGACYKDANTSDISDYNKMIDLAAEDPDDFFTYLANGEMIPKVGLLAENREKAVFTRDRFNLNFNALVEQRRNVLLEIDCFLQGGMTAEDILEVSEGMGFPSVVRYALRELYGLMD